MMQRLFLFPGLLVCLVGVVWAETPLPLANAGFEDGEVGWTDLSPPFATVSAESARSGKLGLRVTDDSKTQGSTVRSAKIPVTAGRHYAVRFWAKMLRRQGVGVYVEFWDEKGRILTTQARGNLNVLGLPARATDWRQFTIAAQAPEGATALTVWIHSFNASITTVDLDDFDVTELAAEDVKTVKTTEVANISDAPFQTPSAARIAEIAAMLPEKPRGIGFPITDRERWDRLARSDRAAAILRHAQTLADTPPPELPDELYLEYTKTGNRRNYEIPYHRSITRIETLVVAECLENKGRFLPAIERDMLAMCEHRSWLMPACDGALTNFKGTHITVALGSSYRAWILANTLYWLGDRLSATTRERTRAEIRRWVLDPYLKALRGGSTRGNWWMICENNWNAVCNAGIVGTALAIVPSAQERAEYIAGMEISNPFFLAGFTDDGYCSEGVGYWGYGFGRYMMLGLMVRDATGGKLDIFADPKVLAAARFPLNILVQSGIAPAFADCSVRARPSADVMALVSRVYPDMFGGQRRTPSGLGGSILRTGFHTLVEDEALDAATVEAGSLPLRSWFADAGILVSRGRADAAVPFGAAIKGGHNAESHNHNDVGSYVVVLGGKALLCDPGAEVYTRRTFSSRRYESKVLNSYGHPVPVVGGTLQSKGVAARGKILETEFTDEMDRLVIDLAPAYQVTALRSLTRTFEHDREAGVIQIEDHVQFAEPTAFNTALITLDRAHQVGPDTFAVYDEAHALAIRVEVTGGAWDYVAEEIENPGRPTPRRLGISLKEPVAEARVRFTIQPRPVDGLPGVYSDPAWDTLVPDLAKAITVQAEDFSEQAGEKVEVCDKVGAQGKALRFWSKPNHRLGWQFKLPAAGRYAVRLRCCHVWKGDVTRTVAIDGKSVGGPPFLFPFTGGWSTTEDNWRNVWLAREQTPLVLDLTAGIHTLSLDTPTETGLNLDWLQLVPVTPK